MWWIEREVAKVSIFFGPHAFYNRVRNPAGVKRRGRNGTGLQGGGGDCADLKAHPFNKPTPKQHSLRHAVPCPWMLRENKPLDRRGESNSLGRLYSRDLRTHLSYLTYDIIQQ